MPKSTEERNANEMRFRSVFTRSDRYTFVDPDYGYTDEETRAIEQHKQQYDDFIHNLREKRQAREKNR